MPVFAYRGLVPGGKHAHGLVDADSARSAWQTLRTRGIYPTSIAPDATPAGRTLPLADLACATRQLASLLAAGVPVTEALAATADLSPAATARALTVVAGRVREGSALADALGGDGARFPELYRAAVRSGEAAAAWPRRSPIRRSSPRRPVASSSFSSRGCCRRCAACSSTPARDSPGRRAWRSR
jgi:general secretion pathway protein F